MKKIKYFTLLPALALILGLDISHHAQAASEAKAPPKQDWQFQGVFGTFDRDALRRGYQIYKEVCASCHSMNQLAFRNLAQSGGPEFSVAEVKALAAQYMVTDGPDEFGDMFERPALPSDRFVPPFANEEAAKASNNGAYPPDLSLITKARSGGADYIYAILIGYEDEVPATIDLRAGQYYNPYMAGGILSMAPPLMDDLVEYSDGTAATAEQMARDVVHFLSWAAEPELETRHRTGFMVLLYLAIISGLLYFSMRKVWADKHNQ